jgi:hypothetical protein
VHYYAPSFRGFETQSEHVGAEYFSIPESSQSSQPDSFRHASLALSSRIVDANRKCPGTRPEDDNLLHLITVTSLITDRASFTKATAQATAQAAPENLGFCCVPRHMSATSARSILQVNP